MIAVLALLAALRVWAAKQLQGSMTWHVAISVVARPSIEIRGERLAKGGRSRRLVGRFTFYTYGVTPGGTPA
jgi:hypothetical protein